MYRQFNNQPYGVFYCRLFLTEIDFFNISVSERVTSHTYSFNSTFFCHALTFLFPFLLALGEFEPFLLSSHGLTSCWSECETAAPWNMMPLSNMPSSFLSQPQFFFHLPTIFLSHFLSFHLLASALIFIPILWLFLSFPRQALRLLHQASSYFSVK